VNVQFQFQRPVEEASVTSAPSAVPVDSVVWVTEPSSPGLRTRTDTFVFPPDVEEDVEVVTLEPMSALLHAQSQSHSQFQTSEV
jgi:hypothetical protein